MTRSIAFAMQAMCGNMEVKKVGSGNLAPAALRGQSGGVAKKNFKQGDTVAVFTGRFYVARASHCTYFCADPACCG